MDDLDVIILCGGKCGSTTLYNTMKYYKYRCIKVHNRLDFIKQFKYDGLYKTIDLSSKNKELFIIDSYRTPIERSISSYFENINKHTPNYKQISTNELISIFNQKFLNKEKYNSINDVMEYYDIPLFEKFDFKKGYVMKKHNNIIFIKILFKDIHRWGDILSKIFCSYITIFPANISHEKEYYNIYQKFKQKYTLPSNYKQLLKNDTDFNIYNQDSIDCYLKKFKIK